MSRVAYGLLLAAFSASATGIRLNEDVVVGGKGAAAYGITIGDQEAVVRVDPDQADDARAACDGADLADAVAGRGPDVAETLGRCDELTTALSITREFLLRPDP